MTSTAVDLELDAVDEAEEGPQGSGAIVHGAASKSQFWRNRGQDIVVARVTTRDIVRDFLKTRALGKTIMVVNVFFSITACGLYVAATYMSDDEQDELYMALPENFFNAWFLCDYIFYIWLAEDRLDHITSGPTICDLLSLLPAINVLIGSDLGFFRFLRAFRAFRVLRAHRVLSFYAPGAWRQVARLFLIIFSCLFVAAGFCHALETIADEVNYEECPGGGDEGCDHPFSQTNMDFHEALYFVIVTFSTVGYGDIYPTHWYSRMIVALFIPCAIVIIPVAGTTIYEIISSQSIYERPYKHHEGWTHVVMCGSLEVNQLRRFLKEWYHKDMGKSNRKRVVLLKPEEPDPSAIVNRILEHPFLETRVSWIRGSVFRRTCMRWVRGLPEMENQAEAFIVTTDTHSTDKHNEDSRAIQRAIAIRRQNPDMQIIVQLLLHESKHRLYQENIDIYCIEELKYAMLGRSCHVKGLTTLLSTMFQCREYVDFDTKTLKAAKAASLSHLGDSEIDTAQLQLIDGLQKEERVLTWQEEWLLNSIRDQAQLMIPTDCEGMLFEDFADLVYLHFGHIVFAMELPVTPTQSTPRVMVNPFGFPLQAGDSVIFLSMGRKVASDFLTQLTEFFATYDKSAHLRRSQAVTKSRSQALLGHTQLTRASALFCQIEQDASLTQQAVPVIIRSNPPSFWEEGNACYSQEQVIQWGHAHIRDSVPPEVSEHIIYHGPLKSAAFFLQALMKEDAYMDEQHSYPWVVLIAADSDVNLYEKQMIQRWEKLTFYEKLILMQGDVTEPHAGLPWCGPSTFQRAGVERAELFVMPHCGGSRQNENLLGDDVTVRVLRNLREHVMLHRRVQDVMRFKPMFVVELLHRHHIEYIRRPLPRPMAYAAGQVVNSQFMDVFPGKMFHSSAALPIIQHMIASWDSRPYVNVTDRDLGFSTVESCHIVLRSIEPKWHGCRFIDFFSHCTRQASLPLGLYRFHADWDLVGAHSLETPISQSNKHEAQEQDADEAMLRDLRYVYLNPRRQDIIHPKDKVYLLVNTLWYQHQASKDGDMNQETQKNENKQNNPQPFEVEGSPSEELADKLDGDEFEARLLEAQNGLGPDGQDQM